MQDEDRPAWEEKQRGERTFCLIQHPMRCVKFVTVLWRFRQSNSVCPSKREEPPYSVCGSLGGGGNGDALNSSLLGDEVDKRDGNIFLPGVGEIDVNAPTFSAKNVPQDTRSVAIAFLSLPFLASPRCGLLLYSAFSFTDEAVATVGPTAATTSRPTRTLLRPSRALVKRRPHDPTTTASLFDRFLPTHRGSFQGG